MNTLPKILSAGLFNSESRLKSVQQTPERKVMCFEWELFCQNTGDVIVNKHVYPIGKGNVLLTKPGDIRCSKPPFACRFIHFEVTDSETYRMLASLPTFIQKNLSSELAALFDRIADYTSGSLEFHSVFVTAALYELICKVKEIDRQSTTFPFETPISKAMEYIHQQYDQAISNNDIAAVAGLSVSYMHKRFLDVVGETPNQYLTRVRLAAAKNLLINTEYSLDIVSQKCGFASATYFSRRFQLAFGISPAKFRKSARYIV